MSLSISLCRSSTFKRSCFYHVRPLPGFFSIPSLPFSQSVPCFTPTAWASSQSARALSQSLKLPLLSSPLSMGWVSRFSLPLHTSSWNFTFLFHVCSVLSTVFFVVDSKASSLSCGQPLQPVQNLQKLLFGSWTAACTIFEYSESWQVITMFHLCLVLVFSSFLEHRTDFSFPGG